MIKITKIQRDEQLRGLVLDGIGSEAESEFSASAENDLKTLIRTQMSQFGFKGEISIEPE